MALFNRLLLISSFACLHAQANDSLVSKAYRWNDLKPVQETSSVRRQVLDGKTFALANFEVHATSLEPGKAPHGPHAHVKQDELVIVKEGMVQVTIGNKATTIGPGSVAVIMAGDAHGVENAGNTKATYYILKYTGGAVPTRAARSFVVNWNDLKITNTGKGHRRDFFNLATSQVGQFEMHTTALNAGEVSHAPHTHIQEEVILVLRGQVEMQMGNVFEKGGAGDLFFLSANTPHALRNIGNEQCEYFAFQWRQLIGAFDAHSDVGNPAIKGDVQYDAGTQEYTLQGAGSNMWFGKDQFHFLYKKIKGDFMISATVRFIGKGVDPHRKIGVIAREQLSPDSRYADACVHGDELTSLQYREAAGDSTRQVIISSFHPTHIELQRIGNTFILSAAAPGENYKTVRKELALNEELFAGLFICSHRDSVLEQAVFSNVRVVIPPAKDFRPYRDYLGSHIEVMDVFTGHRKILHSAPNSLQAPNWTKDGKQLIYNSEGLMYTYSLAGGVIKKLNTGFADQNNNDHVLSFDGKWLGLSHHVGEKRTSTLFTVPVTGSDKPTQITQDSGHSWLHGFSPDGRKLIFTGWRNKQYDIWTIDIATKKETQLTNTPSLDDAPEYSPDGKWVYFNSVRTGSMKIWRMRADGSGQEQVTFDEYNDWFPHFSPDGKWIVYLSYPKDIDPTDHPWYQKVYIRLMPAAGGVPRNIAYVFGGQGTINVPSWSPDSRRIAFVSNSNF